MAACPSLSVTWPEELGLSTTEAAVPGAPAQGQAAPTLSMDALRKLSSRRRASAREQELMTTDVSVESSSSLVSSSCTMVAWQSEMLSFM